MISKTKDNLISSSLWENVMAWWLWMKKLVYIERYGNLIWNLFIICRLSTDQLFASLCLPGRQERRRGMSCLVQTSAQRRILDHRWQRDSNEPRGYACPLLQLGLGEPWWPPEPQNSMNRGHEIIVNPYITPHQWNEGVSLQYPWDARERCMPKCKCKCTTHLLSAP